MTDKTKDIVAWLNSQECCQMHGGPGCHPSRCGECPRDAADAITQLQRDNAALMADGAEQARLAKEACERAALFRLLLDDMAKEFVRVFPIYYYAEPWAHDRNVALKAALAALAQKEG